MIRSHLLAVCARLKQSLKMSSVCAASVGLMAVAVLEVLQQFTGPCPLLDSIRKVTDHHQQDAQVQASGDFLRRTDFMPDPNRKPSLAVVIVMLALAVPTRAQQYSFRYYGVDDGLTNLAVKVLLQDRMGFLWAGTENGVFRYDGQRFQRYGPDEGLPHEVVLSLGEAPDGSVLAGYRVGLYRGRGGRFEKVSLPGGGGIDSYSAIASDGQGRTFIGAERGLIVATIDGSRLELRLLATPRAAGGAAAHGVFVEGTALWYGCGTSLCRMTGEHVSVFSEADGLPAGRWMSIRRVGGGDLWVHDQHRFARMRAGTDRFDASDPGFPQTAGGAQMEVDSGGRLLIPTIEGLTINEGRHFRTIGNRENIRGPVYAVLQDREGSIWLGLAGHGLARWRGYREWEGFNSESGLGSELIYAILPLGNGTVLAGTEDGLFIGRRAGGRWTWNRHPGVGKIPVHTLQLENDGSVWLGTERGGAAKIDTRTGETQWFKQDHGLTAVLLFSLVLDRAHRVWAATESGLFVAQLSEKRFQRVEEIPPVNCWAVTEGPDGEILVGTRAGLFRLSGGHWLHVSAIEGLLEDAVLSVAAVRPGEIWVGYRYSGSITRIRMDGERLSMTHYGSELGLRGEISYFLGFDARGQLWAGTDQGVRVWDGEHWNQYDHDDGLIWDDCDVQGFAAEPDGSVWIGTSGGLARYLVSPMTRQVRSPTVVFTRLILGKHEVQRDSDISTDYASNSLVARYSALVFAREHSVIYRYRLQPVQNEWRQTRQPELQFPQLPPNNYRLEIEAGDGQGQWSTQPAVFAFEIRKPLWRTWWFLGLTALVPVAFVHLISRQRRLRQRQIRCELERLVAQRTTELEIARTQAELLATSDPLTGIFNRRGLFERAERDLQLAQRRASPVSVAIFDLDHFKRINDTCGHGEGDRVLHEIGSVLKSTVRATDLFGRIGGEEFMVVMPDTPPEEAVRVADRIRVALSAVVFAGRPPAPVTASFGVAGTPIGGGSLDSLQSAADAALYRAKRSGRDRVELGACDDRPHALSRLNEKSG
jgi:diguanylate cyclase (GGDEF)-like protein